MFFSFRHELSKTSWKLFFVDAKVDVVDTNQSSMKVLPS